MIASIGKMHSDRFTFLKLISACSIKHRLIFGQSVSRDEKLLSSCSKWVAQKRIDRLIRDPILFKSFRMGEVRFENSSKLNFVIFVFSFIPLFFVLLIISIFGRILPRIKFPRYLCWDAVFDDLDSVHFFSSQDSKRYILKSGFHPTGIARRLAIVSYSFLYSLGLDRNIILNFCKASFFSYRFLNAGVSLSDAWIIFFASVSFLSKRETLFDTVVISNSRWSRQPFFVSVCASKCELSMVWNSENVYPLHTSERRKIVIPSYVFSLVKNHYCITDSLSRFLMSHSPFSRFFYRFADSAVKLDMAKMRGLNEVRIFDVIPRKDSSFLFGYTEVYYQFPVLRKFILDVLAAIDVMNRDHGYRIRAELYSKRSFIEGVHDPEYREFISGVALSNPLLRISEGSADADERFGGGVGVCLPYSSVHLECRVRGVCCIVYDPTGVLVRYPAAGQEYFVNSFEGLCRMLGKQVC